MEQFQAIADELSNQILSRLEGLPYASQQDYDDDQQIVTEFNKIAAGMLQQEPGLEMPGSPQPIPMDEARMAQALQLFVEGVYFCLTKCVEFGVVGELKKTLLQNLAMEIYGQAKQVVAATYGQEHTPDFQFTIDQQVDIINKATEGHLMAFIAEYEKANGPLQPDGPPAQAVLSQPQSMPPPLYPEQNTHPAKPASALPVAITPKTTTGHDKYGAVALLLTMLPASQGARILKRFNDEERELIAYYGNPQHIEQNLDLATVEMHLKRFKDMVLNGQGDARPKNSAYQGIARLAEQNTMEKLLSCIKDERPTVMQYVQSHFAPKSLSAVPRSTGTLDVHPDHAQPDALPPRIEEILYRYLAKRLTPE